MELPIYQVDAFASRLFAGNPAAVVPLEAWLPEKLLQAIAAENNLSETAFFVRRPDGSYDLRWFTPTVEAKLCGHATLASSYVIYRFLDPAAGRLRFHTLSGLLEVWRAPGSEPGAGSTSAGSPAASGASASSDGEWLTLDFPARRADPAPAPEGLLRSLGLQTARAEVFHCEHGIYLVALGSEAAVRELRPDFLALAALGDSVCVTASGESCDFVSRYFAPAKGIPEDPVTGSAHCLLAPFWAQRLGKREFAARQVSARGGELRVRDLGDRIEISGQAQLYLRGTIRA